MAHFCAVYTEEAHPSELGHYTAYPWPTAAHADAEARLAAARVLDGLDDLPGPLLADNMDDEACRAYGSFPDRLYVVVDGNVAYQGGVGPHGYNVSVAAIVR